MATLAINKIEGKILDTNGKVFAERNGERIELKIDDPIYESDVIITDEATTTDILYRDGTKSRVAPNTKFTLTDYEFGEGDDEPSFVMDLAQGAVRTATGEIVKLNPEGFEVITPRATAGIRGTEFINSVDSVTGNETHAVLFISGGSIMLVTDTQGNSLSLSQPLQVTRFSNDSTSASPIQTISAGQMETVINSIASSIGGDIPQSPTQQGQWNKVEPVIIDDRTEEEKEAQEAAEAEAEQQQGEADAAAREADAAAQEALANAPDDLDQGNAEVQTIVVVVSEGEEDQISDVIKALEDADYNVVVVNPENSNDNLNQLHADANNAFIEPELEGNDNQPTLETLTFNFTTYKGGNLTRSDGKMFTKQELAESSEDIILNGFQIIGSDMEEPILVTGSGNDIISLGAKYENGSFTHLTYDYESVMVSSSDTHVSVYNALIETGAGNDTIYINHSSTTPDSPQRAVVDSRFSMGDGDDSFTLANWYSVDDSFVDMGAGNDTVTVYTSIDIDTGLGFDVVNQYTQSLSITDSDNLTVNYNNHSYGQISTEIEGNGAYTLNIGANAQFESFNLDIGDANTLINFNKTLDGQSFDFDFGLGKEYLYFFANANNATFNIESGYGVTTIVSNYDISNSSFELTGDGNTAFHLNTINNTTIRTDDSSGSNDTDNIYIQSMTDGSISTFGSNDTVIVHNIYSSNASNTLIDTGALNDTIGIGNVGAGSQTVKVNAGSGNDIIIYEGTSGNISFTLGTGSDIFNNINNDSLSVVSDAGSSDIYIGSDIKLATSPQDFGAYLFHDNDGEKAIADTIVSHDDLTALGIKVTFNGQIYINTDIWDDNGDSDGYNSFTHSNGLEFVFSEGSVIETTTETFNSVM